MADHNNPQSRAEEILIATIDGTEYDKLPQSRLEELLLELKEVIEEGGGGGEGGLIQKIFLNGVEQQITNKAVYLTVITNTVNDLVNYYLKTDTYSKLEVNNLIAAIQTVHLQKVETLPTEDISQTTIYLVPKSTLLTNNVYDEYINTDGTSTGWELIGDTQIDLSDYVTFTDLEALLDDYVLATDLTTTLADYALASDMTAALALKANTADVTSALAGKVDKVTGKGLSTNDFTDTYKDAVDANTTAISGIKDGSDIDSFGDVEVALLDKADTSDLGTAAAKDSTNSVTAGSTDLVESGAVKDAIDAAVAAAYHHAGTKTVAQLTHDLLIAANEGNVYNITDSGTTTSDFIEGIGKQIDAGDNVGICKVGNVYMFDLLSGLEDTSIFVQKSQTSGLLKNDGTVNTTIEDTVAGHTTAIAGKQDKYDTITYAQWQAMTPEQQAAKDYYISDYPSSVLTAGNIAYDNTSSGMAANKVQGAIDELKSGLTNHFKTITSGSLHDITQSGIYYLTGGVTDKPIGLGGMYIVCVYNSAISVGLYISYLDDSEHKQVSIVTHHDDTWDIADITSAKRT